MKTQLTSSPELAATILDQGELVALPTETVYGLAGNATRPEVVKKIFAAKERPSFDPLIVHFQEQFIQSDSPLESLVNAEILSATVLQWKNRRIIESVMKKFWPGPLTMIFPKGSRIPNEVTSNQDTVGIRCPRHPLFQSVLSKIKFPLAAPSANRFGRISPTTAEHVQKELDGRIAGILDGGACEVGVESTIIQISEHQIHLLRPGKISKSELEVAFGKQIQVAPSLMQKISESAVAPGMLDEHYAPRKSLYLIPLSFQDDQSIPVFNTFPESTNSNAAILSMSGIHPDFPMPRDRIHRILSPDKSLEVMAQNLFSAMRELDEHPLVSCIFVDIPKDFQEGLGASIVDRLKRASRNKPSFPV